MDATFGLLLGQRVVVIQKENTRRARLLTYEDFIKIDGIEIRDLPDQLSGGRNVPVRPLQKVVQIETVTIVTKGVQSPKGRTGNY